MEERYAFRKAKTWLSLTRNVLPQVHYTLSCSKEKRGELNYKCPECDYATKRERDLKRYSETHTSTKQKPEESNIFEKILGIFLN